MTKIEIGILLGTHAKIYHDLAKKWNTSPGAVKLLLNSTYGGNAKPYTICIE